MTNSLLVLMSLLGTVVSGSDSKSGDAPNDSPVPWGTLLSEQKAMEQAAKEVIWYKYSEQEQKQELISKGNILIEPCILKGVEHIQKLSLSEYNLILASVILVDLYESDVKSRKYSWDRFSEHIELMFKSPKDMLYFLKDYNYRNFRVDCSRLRMLADKMGQMAREGKVLDSSSYPVMIDVDGRYTLSPLYIEHQEMLVSIKDHVESIVNIFLKCVRTYRGYSIEAVKFALGSEEGIRKMTSNDVVKMLRLVVLTDHYGKFGGRNINMDDFPEHVAPLLMGSDEEKLVFLRTFCERVCSKQYKAASELKGASQPLIDTRSNSSSSQKSGERNADVLEEFQKMLTAAKSYITFIILGQDTPFIILGQDTQDYFYREHCKLAIKYAVGGDREVQEMTFKDLKSILQLVVLADHHGQYGGKRISEEELPAYVAPLFQDSAKEKRIFLLDLCERICNDQLKAAKPQ